MDEQDPERRYAEEVLEFARHLKVTSRTGPLLGLRDANSHLLHLLGRHDVRSKMGELALASAVETDSHLHRASILIDDLGWAVFSSGNVTRAVKNILNGIDVASSFVAGDDHYVEAGLIQAKGYRHLAVISQGVEEQTEYLQKASVILSDLESSGEVGGKYLEDLARDSAQLLHAKASLLVRSLPEGDGRPLPPTAAAEINKAKQADELLTEAVGRFRQIHDNERTAKALMLKERIQMLLGETDQAIQTRAMIGQVLRVE